MAFAAVVVADLLNQSLLQSDPKSVCTPRFARKDSHFGIHGIRADRNDEAFFIR